MNYLNGELHYTFQPSQAYCFYGDNTLIANGNVSGNDSIRDYMRNFTTLNSKGAPLMIYLPKDTTSGYLFFNVKMDYIYFNVANYQIELKEMQFNEDETLNSFAPSDYVGYMSAIQNTTGSDMSFGEITIRQYKTAFQSGITKSVYDLSRTEHYFGDIAYDDLSGQVFNVYDSRPDNSLFYNYCLYVSGYNLNANTIDILHADDSQGSAIYNSYEQAYQNGYENGYGDGYGNGYTDGYNSNMDGNTLTAFNYISQAFQSVTNVLAIQILPNVTLGLVFSIPMVFTLILLTFKLIKK